MFWCIPAPVPTNSIYLYGYILWQLSTHNHTATESMLGVSYITYYYVSKVHYNLYTPSTIKMDAIESVLFFITDSYVEISF